MTRPMNARRAIPILALTLAVFGLGFWLGVRSASKPPPTDPAPAETPFTDNLAGNFDSARLSDLVPDAAARAAAAKKESALAAILGGGDLTAPLDPADVAAFVTLNRTNAQSLLAAFENTHDLQWLRLAVERHPDDPRVMLAVVNHDAFPGEKRAWLDRLADAAPDNPLVDYLSAADHLKDKDPDAALEALLNAGGKTGFNDYTLDTIQGAEEMRARSGQSPSVAKAAASVQTRLPHLQQIRDLGREMVKVYQAKVSAGDIDSANRIAAAGLEMGRHLSVGDGNRFLINELVGIVTEKTFLEALDPTVEHPFLNRPLPDLKQELENQRENIKTLGRYVDVEKMSGQDAVEYFDRMKLYGEYDTLKWFYERGGGR